MATKRTIRPLVGEELAQVIGALSAPRAHDRAVAVRRICPCRAGFEPFEQHYETVVRMQKDPEPRVRREATHVLEEAFELQGGRGHAPKPCLIPGWAPIVQMKPRDTEREAEPMAKPPRRRRGPRGRGTLVARR